MAKKKNKENKVDNEFELLHNRLTSIVIILIGLLITILISTTLIYTIILDGYLENIFIPDSDMINEFCKENGYEYGWLSSFSCGINEVQCVNSEKKSMYYECIDMSKYLNDNIQKEIVVKIDCNNECDFTIINASLENFYKKDNFIYVDNT